MHLESARTLKRQLWPELRTEIAAVGMARAAVAIGVCPLPAGQWPARGQAGASHVGEFGVALRYSGASTAAERLILRIRQLAGDACDIRDVGDIHPQSTPDAPGTAPDDLQSRTRPLRPGLSIAHVDVTAGTVGAFVEPVVRPGEVHVLSNSHVLADSGHGQPGDAVVQPGPADGGLVPDDRVGVLDRIAPLRTEVSNVVDAATARLDPDIEVSAEYPGGFLQGWDGITAWDENADRGDNTDRDDNTGRVEDGDRQDTGPPRTASQHEDAHRRGSTASVAVEKVGRTTGVTRGQVSAFEIDGLVIQFPDGPLEFHDQIEVAGNASGPFSAGGDSGSLVYRPNSREALGLLFAGSERGGPAGTGLTYCNPIEAVLSELAVRPLPSP